MVTKFFVNQIYWPLGMLYFVFFISHLFYFGVFQQPHCYTSVTSQLQEAEGFD